METETSGPAEQGDAIARLQALAESSLPRSTIEKALHRVPASADVKAIFAEIAEVSVRVGREIVRVGRLIASFVIDLAQRFRHTAFGLILGLAVATLISFVPWIGPFVAGFLWPLLTALGVFVGGSLDMRERALEGRLRLLDRLEEADRKGLLDRLAVLEGQFRAADATVAAQGGASDGD